MNSAQNYLTIQIEDIQRKINDFQYILNMLIKTKNELFSLIENNQTHFENISPPLNMNLEDSQSSLNVNLDNKGIPQNEPMCKIINPNDIMENFEDNFDMRAYIEHKRDLMNKMTERELKREKEDAKVKEEAKNEVNEEAIPISPLMRYSTKRQKYILYKIFQMSKKNVENQIKEQNIDDSLKQEKINEEANRLMNLWEKSELSGNSMFYVP
jgi:hypothetical protein